MNTYFYDFDKKSGIKMSQAVLEYDDESESHRMRITLGVDHNTSVDIYPEELADIYRGKLGEHLIHRIKRAVIREQSQRNQEYLDRELNPVIKEYVSAIAVQMGLEISKASFIGGLQAACVDYRLEIASKSHLVSTLINKLELEIIESGSMSGYLEHKVVSALEQLKRLQNPHTV